MVMFTFEQCIISQRFLQTNEIELNGLQTSLSSFKLLLFPLLHPVPYKANHDCNSNFNVRSMINTRSKHPIWQTLATCASQIGHVCYTIKDK